MNVINVKVKAAEGVQLPEYKTSGSAGCDVTSSKDVIIPAGSRSLVGTGLFLEVPKGYECQIRSRSGLALQHGVSVLNSPGTLDSDYRGEVKVLLQNHGNIEFRVKKGDRIAQLVFAPVSIAVFEEVNELAETTRGSGGFGSTGVSPPQTLQRAVISNKTKEEAYMDAAKHLSTEHKLVDTGTLEVYLFRDPELIEVRLLEISKSVGNSADLLPFKFPARPDLDIHFSSSLILVSPSEFGRVINNELRLPDGWDLSKRELL